MPWDFATDFTTVRCPEGPIWYSFPGAKRSLYMGAFGIGIPGASMQQRRNLTLRLGTLNSDPTWIETVEPGAN
jgi:hypothetical protein